MLELIVPFIFPSYIIYISLVFIYSALYYHQLYAC